MPGYFLLMMIKDFGINSINPDLNDAQRLGIGEEEFIRLSSAQP
jgi:hypothetical protein